VFGDRKADSAPVGAVCRCRPVSGPPEGNRGFPAVPNGRCFLLSPPWGLPWEAFGAAVFRAYCLALPAGRGLLPALLPCAVGRLLAQAGCSALRRDLRRVLRGGGPSCVSRDYERGRLPLPGDRSRCSGAVAFCFRGLSPVCSWIHRRGVGGLLGEMPGTAPFVCAKESSMRRARTRLCRGAASAVPILVPREVVVGRWR